MPFALKKYWPIKDVIQIIALISALLVVFVWLIVGAITTIRWIF